MGRCDRRQPIERFFWPVDPTLGEPVERDVVAERGLKIACLASHYGAQNLAQLVVAIVSEFNPALTIIDAPPPRKGKTSRKWRGGVDGAVLIHRVGAVSEYLRKKNGGRKVKLEAELAELQARLPLIYGKYSLDHLGNLYRDAKRHLQKQEKHRQKLPSLLWWELLLADLP